MSDIDQARSLFRLAGLDIGTLLATANLPQVADSIYGFHGQQAIEKLLKSWLAAKGVLYPKTHQLARLLSMIEENGEAITDLLPLVRYTVFAVEARYEGGVMLDESLDRARVLADVIALRERIAPLLGETTS
jgi:HEPN domain-containing protein